MRISIRGVASAFPDLLLGILCLTVWLEPHRLGVHRIRDVVLLMLMEFIVIHSSAFMGAAAWGGFAPRLPRAVVLLGFGLFYTLFVGGFALGFKTWAPLIGFWLLTANRLSGVFLSQADGNEQALVMKGWAVSTLFYLGAVFATIFLPVPRFGITPEVVTLADIPGDGGLWVNQPHTVIAAGFLYFTACGLSELIGHNWLPGTVEVGRRRSKVVEDGRS